VNRARLFTCLALALIVAAFVATGTMAAGNEAPTLELTSAAVKRTKPNGRFAGSVTLHVRMCLSVGPRAQLIVTETRRLGAAVKARATWTDPLGVDLVKVYPYDCVSGYMLSWVLGTRFSVGPGTYTVTVRLRDGYGRLTAPVLVSLRPGG
jgi:hypothetical protein